MRVQPRAFHLGFVSDGFEANGGRSTRELYADRICRLVSTTFSRNLAVVIDFQGTVFCGLKFGRPKGLPSCAPANRIRPTGHRCIKILALGDGRAGQRFDFLLEAGNLSGLG